MNTSNRSKQLLEGLAIGAIVIFTLAGAVLLSTRNTIALPNTSPTPIVPATPSATAAPINTPGPTINAATHAPTVTQSATATSTGTSTPTPAPTRCPPPIGWQPYTVGSFDTLFLIAQKFNVDPNMLSRANCLSNYAVTVGQTIYVPSTLPTATTAPCYPPYYWAIYSVQPGDTLTAIAARYNISVYQLWRANCLASSFIYVGQLLRVPPIMIYPTATPTFIPSATPTATPTNTPTPSITPSATSTVTPTPSATSVPTIGSSPTPTDTSTPTPTDTTVPPSPTPTDTPTTIPPSPTDTATLVPPTATDTPTPPSTP
ncbi:MAG TPA: LysM peptidoglycan-binding domain-containing protein [Anaerolineae bacterium]|nr:LysM peptidoglycan-binding domain-containing protein [Anaerolineae bacterium]